MILPQKVFKGRQSSAHQHSSSQKKKGQTDVPTIPWFRSLCSIIRPGEKRSPHRSLPRLACYCCTALLLVAEKNASAPLCAAALPTCVIIVRLCVTDFMLMYTQHNDLRQSIAVAHRSYRCCVGLCVPSVSRNEDLPQGEDGFLGYANSTAPLYLRSSV